MPSRIYNIIYENIEPIVTFPTETLSLFMIKEDEVQKIAKSRLSLATQNGIPKFMSLAFCQLITSMKQIYGVGVSSDTNSDFTVIETDHAALFLNENVLTMITTFDANKFHELKNSEIFTFLELYILYEINKNGLVELLNNFITDVIPYEKVALSYVDLIYPSVISLFDLESLEIVKKIPDEIQTKAKGLMGSFGITAGAIIDPISTDFFNFFEVKSNTKKIQTDKKSFNKKNWNVNLSRKFSDEENLMMTNSEIRLQSYVPIEISKDFVETFYNSTKNSDEPIFSALLYGGSGTGKTEMVQFLGNKLHIPVTTFQCTANTEETDLIGKTKSLGIKADSSGIIEYTNTPLTEAITKGWIIEIQEIASIKESGVVQIFNSLLDGTRNLLLPDGRQIDIHPDFKIVFTTNVTYEGCQNLNQSFISRCQFTACIPNPTKNEFVKRLISKSGWTGDEAIIKDVVAVLENINNFLNEESVDDGSCDFRSALDWIKQYLITDWGWIKCAKYTILPKATLQQEYHSSILEIIKAKFEI